MNGHQESARALPVQTNTATIRTAVEIENVRRFLDCIIIIYYYYFLGVKKDRPLTSHSHHSATAKGVKKGGGEKKGRENGLPLQQITITVCLQNKCNKSSTRADARRHGVAFGRNFSFGFALIRLTDLNGYKAPHLKLIDSTDSIITIGGR